MSRNQQRSDKNREYMGSIFLLVNEIKIWRRFNNDPLDWLVELSEHEKFHKVFRELYTRANGSIYTESVTVEKLREFCTSINLCEFKALLYAASVESQAGKQQYKTGAPTQSVELAIHHAPELVVEQEYLSAEEWSSEDIQLLERQCNIQFSVETTDLHHLEPEMIGEKVSASTCSETSQIIDSDNNSADAVLTIKGMNIIKAFGPVCENPIFKKILLENDVYGFGEKIYKHLETSDAEIKFPLVIYAPPNSGKSTFNDKYLKSYARDTDQMLYWTGPYSSIVMTNMSQYVLRAKASVAVIPTREEMRRRCLARDLNYQESWYDDVLRNIKRATLLIYTDDYLMKVYDNNIRFRQLVASVLPDEDVRRRSLFDHWAIDLT